METTNRLTSQTDQKKRENISYHIGIKQPNLNKQINAIDDEIQELHVDEIRELHVVDKDRCVNWSIDCVASPGASPHSESKFRKKPIFIGQKPIF